MRSRANSRTTNRVMTGETTGDSARGKRSGGVRADGAPRARRGSALVMVVGTLALIAVIAAFYVTLGQAAARVSRGVERGAEVDDIERQVAQYIASIIADDRLAVYPETITNDEQLIGARYLADNSLSLLALDGPDRQRFIREATDYPYTDFTKISIVSQETVQGSVWEAYGNKPRNLAGNPQDVVEQFRFRPAGDDRYMLDLRGALDTLTLSTQEDALADRRTGSDPWLAASLPTFTGRLEFGTQSQFSHDDRVYSREAGGFANILMRNETVVSALSGGVENRDAYPELYYLDNRDWAQISNLSADDLPENVRT